jgi:sarcosine oxidase gamma subunit
MIVRHATGAAMALILSAGIAHAGPCTDRIYQADLDVAKLLHAAAAQAHPAVQSTFATMHRQPTPGSVASAEQQAGTLNPDEVQAITEDMDEARRADDQGDTAACEKALSEVDRMLKE